jgi:hypothetical protein
MLSPQTFVQYATCPMSPVLLNPQEAKHMPSPNLHFRLIIRAFGFRPTSTWHWNKKRMVGLHVSASPVLSKRARKLSYVFFSKPGLSPDMRTSQLLFPICSLSSNQERTYDPWLGRRPAPIQRTHTNLSHISVLCFAAPRNPKPIVTCVLRLVRFLSKILKPRTSWYQDKITGDERNLKEHIPSYVMRGCVCDLFTISPTQATYTSTQMDVE